MSTTKATTIWCDAKDPDGHDCTEWQEEQTNSVSDARKRLHRRGWKFINGRDYCPEHAKEHRSL